MFNTVGVVARVGSELVRDGTEAVIAALRRRGVTIVLEADTAGMLGDASLHRAPRAELGASCDLVVVIGGDGSLLGVARDLCDAGKPVLGVNRGGLGFLAGVAPDVIEPELDRVLDGEYTSEAHFLLCAHVMRGKAETARSLALNDVVLHGAGHSHMLEFSVYVDDEWVYDMRGDGLIVSSPTGSTAYSLSAGGPIMHPSLDAIVLVPMFPHTLTSRPLVIPGESVVTVLVKNERDTAVRASCDSQVHLELGTASALTIRKHPVALRLLYPLGHNFYGSCRSKLDWATRLGGG
ncbi:MAG: NAD(+) kinase [Pseudomonadales bacterium]